MRRSFYIKHTPRCLRRRGLRSSMLKADGLVLVNPTRPKSSGIAKTGLAIITVVDSTSG
jgi:hypothetical protein